MLRGPHRPRQPAEEGDALKEQLYQSGIRNAGGIVDGLPLTGDERAVLIKHLEAGGHADRASLRRTKLREMSCGSSGGGDTR
jgi:hypothetical protein